VVLPTFARLSFKDFVDLEGVDFYLAATILEPNHGDGTALFTVLGFLNHDLGHIESMQKDRNFRSKWKYLHQEIAKKIYALPVREQRYTFFIYYYFLHEEYVRSAIYYYLLHKDEGTADKINIKVKTEKELEERIPKLRDLINPHYYGKDFSDVENKKEILDLGFKNLFDIFVRVHASLQPAPGS